MSPGNLCHTSRPVPPCLCCLVSSKFDTVWVHWALSHRHVVHEYLSNRRCSLLYDICHVAIVLGEIKVCGSFCEFSFTHSTRTILKKGDNKNETCCGCLLETEWEFSQEWAQLAVAPVLTLPPHPLQTLCVDTVVSYLFFFCVGMKYLNQMMLILRNIVE